MQKETGQSRNISFALSERLAFAIQLEGFPETEDIKYRDETEDDVDASHADLTAAREQLHAFAVLRLKELQCLTRWPLVKPPKAQQTRRTGTLEEAESPWAVLGEQHTTALPELPSLVRKDLLGPMELLLAMAGQLNRDVGSADPGCQTSSLSRASEGLPWSLGLVSFLPALRTLQAPSLGWLRSFFSDLRPQQRHVGLDDRQHPWFKDLKLHSARALSKEGSAAMSRSFLRFGCPHGVRAQIWEAALCLGPLRPQDVDGFAMLCRTAQAQQTLFDVAICDDIQSVADSEQFFLFEEMLRAVMLAFSRDWQVPQRTAVELHPSVAAVAGPCLDSSLTSLPCNMVHVHGLAVLAAPLCFMYEHPAAVYRMYRSMYTRYWCKLHSLLPVAGQSPALPVLTKTYEDLLQELDPEVVAHVHGIGLPVVALAHRWICSAFAGHLPIEEVLLLWDRVLGLDSLLPLPLLAAAIVCFRRQVILTCQSGSEVLEVMSDISQLKTMPLLQAVLFHG